MKVKYLDLSLQLQAIRPEIDQRFNEIFSNCQFILGDAVERCEKALSQFVGAPYCVTAASGTDALLMALMARGIGAGDEVITTSFSFFATAEVIALLGATPVFVDITNSDFNMDVKQVESRITDRTKAIMPVSLYGAPANMEELVSIAKKHSLLLVEDAAQSFGALQKGKRSCNLSDMGGTSFFPAKPLGCYGDGGAIFCQKKEDYDRLLQIRNHGQTRRYHHEFLGINGRLDAFQCAVVETKLKRYPWEIEQRNRIANLYNEAFKEIGSLKAPEVLDGNISVWAQYTLRSTERKKWIDKLLEKGIPTSIHYPKGMHQQPAMAAFLTENTVLPLCEQAAEEVFSLPLYADMPDADVEQVIVAVKEVAAEI